MPHDPKEPQVLVTPKTRLTQAWRHAWQQYRGDAPRKLITVQQHVIPGIRHLAYRHAKKG